MNHVVHVFAGHFESVEEARRYAEPQWEPEPSADATDEEYSAWEERNPTWALRTDLNVYLDSDFIETVDDADRFAYLEGILVNPSEIEEIRMRAPADANVLVLIFHQALGGFAVRLNSTTSLTYCGEYLSSPGRR